MASVAQETPKPSLGGEIVQLPKYTVTELSKLPPPERWRYATVDGLEILSNASDGETSRLLQNLGDFRQVLRKLWPAPVKAQRNVALVLCRRRDKFSDFTPTSYNQASLLLPGRERSAIIVDLEAVSIGVDDERPVDIEHALLLNREYIRLLLGQGGRRAPAWLEEGICQLFIETEFDDDWIVFGRVRTEQNISMGKVDVPGRGELSFKQFLIGDHKQLMPLGELFAVTHDSDMAQNAMGNQVWTKQAYAFVHMCLTGKNLRYRPALLTFAGRLEREPLSEALFKECFNIGYKDMLDELRGYLRYTKHKYERIKLAPGERLVASQVSLREATDGEIGRIKGDAQMLAGRKEDAQLTYRMAYGRGAREPALLAALGVSEAVMGNPALATPLLTATVRAGVDRPAAYVALARLRLAEARTAPRGPDGLLDENQVAAVLTPLFSARKLPVALPETYELIAETWSLSASPPTRASLEVLDEGIRAFPRNSALLFRAAQLYQQAGEVPVATSVARLGLRFTTDAGARAKFEQLLASLPTASPAR